MAKNSCEIYPIINNQPSELYKGLLNITGNNRPLTNYIYAAYLQSGVAASMDDQGLSVNAQGQHNAQDVFNFLHGEELVSDSTYTNIELSLSNGFMIDKEGIRLKDFTQDEAYTKAMAFNASHSGKIAYVTQKGNAFNINVDDRTSYTLDRLSDLNHQKLAWDEMKAEMTSRGIDLEALHLINPSVINALRLPDFVLGVSSLRFAELNSLSLEDIKTVLELTKNLPSTKALINRFNDAETIFNRIQELNTLGNSAKVLLENSLKDSVREAANTIRTVSDNVNERVQTSLEADTTTSIVNTIKELNNEYGINHPVLVRTSNDVKKLSEAAAEAVISLERQIANLKTKITADPDALEELRITRESLLNSIASRKYYGGLLDFMSQALKYAQSVDSRLTKTPTGTRWEQIKQRAEILSKERNLRESYLSVISALSNLDLLTVDSDLTTQEREALQSTAVQVKNILEAQASVAKELALSSVKDLCIEVLGDDPSLAPAIANMVKMGDTNVGFMDMFYAVGRSSNPLIATMGAVIRDAQESRDKKLGDISRRIRIENDKLRKAGYDSSFMYDEDGVHIISDIDWAKYRKAYNKVKAAYINSGITGVALDDAMNDWVEENTIAQIVDKTNDRTEQIPNAEFRKNLPYMSQAQLEYYTNMKQIMGELGSLLPEQYQSIYLAPQIEKNWHQIIIDGIKGNVSGKTKRQKLINTINLLLDRMSPKKRKDETKYGIQEGDTEFISTRGDFDNHVKRQIPIFYHAKLDNKEALLKNYSMALQIYASSALNFSCMNEVKNVLTMMQDGIAGLGTSPTSKNSVRGEVVKDNPVSIVKVLKDKGLISAEAITSGYIESQLYGIKDVSDSDWARVGQALIGYTSWKGLTFNVVGGVSNILVGEAQMLIDAGAGEYYNIGDYARANAILFGSKVTDAPSAIMDLFTGNMTSKSALLADMFDPLNEKFNNLKSARYYRSPIRQLLGNFDSGFVYGSGESLLHYTNMYSVLCHEKVLLNGKVTSLYDVLEREKGVNGDYRIKVAEGAVNLDGSALDDNYLLGIKRRVRYINQQTHGAMNSEDKGNIHRHLIGRMIMNFRQWMVEHASRRFRKTHFDESARDISLTNFYFGQQVLLNGKKVDLYHAFDKISAQDGSGAVALKLKSGVTSLNGTTLTDSSIDAMLSKFKAEQGWREGFYYSTWNLLKSIATGIREGEFDIAAKWNDLSFNEKANVKRALSEGITIMSLLLISNILGDPSDHKDEAARRFWILQVKRLITDELAFTPTPFAANNIITLVNSPIASIRTIDEFMSLFNYKDLGKTVEAGRHKGENKYWRNVKKNVIPGYKQIDGLIHIGEDDSIFMPYR